MIIVMFHNISVLALPLLFLLTIFAIVKRHITSEKIGEKIDVLTNLYKL